MNEFQVDFFVCLFNFLLIVVHCIVYLINIDFCFVCSFISLDIVFCLLLLDPFMMPHMQVDKGAIKFILSGANIMCPGLTSPGAKMAKVEAETIVVSFQSLMCCVFLCRLPYPVLFINSSRLSCLAEPGLGAPLSSYLEGALYKLIYR